jgi:hypothetical protein
VPSNRCEYITEIKVINICSLDCRGTRHPQQDAMMGTPGPFELAAGFCSLSRLQPRKYTLYYVSTVDETKPCHVWGVPRTNGFSPQQDRHGRQCRDCFTYKKSLRSNRSERATPDFTEGSVI